MPNSPVSVFSVYVVVLLGHIPVIGEKEREDAAAETKCEEVGARVNCRVQSAADADGSQRRTLLSLSPLDLFTYSFGKLSAADDDDDRQGRVKGI